MTIEQIKEMVAGNQYDFLRTNPHLAGKVIFPTLGGSHAYGTNIETSDVDVRGCAHYQREILKQPTLLDILSSLPRQPKYNPVEKAYDILYKFTDKNAGWDEASTAIEEAIGFLGEALAE